MVLKSICLLEVNIISCDVEKEYKLQAAHEYIFTYLNSRSNVSFITELTTKHILKSKIIIIQNTPKGCP